MLGKKRRLRPSGDAGDGPRVVVARTLDLPSIGGGRGRDLAAMAAKTESSRRFVSGLEGGRGGLNAPDALLRIDVSEVSEEGRTGREALESLVEGFVGGPSLLSASGEWLERVLEASAGARERVWGATGREGWAPESASKMVDALGVEVFVDQVVRSYGEEEEKALLAEASRAKSMQPWMRELLSTHEVWRAGFVVIAEALGTAYLDSVNAEMADRETSGVLLDLATLGTGKLTSDQTRRLTVLECVNTLAMSTVGDTRSGIRHGSVSVATAMLMARTAALLCEMSDPRGPSLLTASRLRRFRDEMTTSAFLLASDRLSVVRADAWVRARVHPELGGHRNGGAEEEEDGLLLDHDVRDEDGDEDGVDGPSATNKKEQVFEAISQVLEGGKQQECCAQRTFGLVRANLALFDNDIRPRLPDEALQFIALLYADPKTLPPHLLFDLVPLPLVPTAATELVAGPGIALPDAAELASGGPASFLARVGRGRQILATAIDKLPILESKNIIALHSILCQRPLPRWLSSAVALLQQPLPLARLLATVFLPTGDPPPQAAELLALATQAEARTIQDIDRVANTAAARASTIFQAATFLRQLKDTEIVSGDAPNRIFQAAAADPVIAAGTMLYIRLRISDPDFLKLGLQPNAVKIFLRIALDISKQQYWQALAMMEIAATLLVCDLSMLPPPGDELGLRSSAVRFLVRLLTQNFAIPVMDLFTNFASEIPQSSLRNFIEGFVGAINLTKVRTIVYRRATPLFRSALDCGVQLDAETARAVRDTAKHVKDNKIDDGGHATRILKILK